MGGSGGFDFLLNFEGALLEGFGRKLFAEALDEEGEAERGGAVEVADEGFAGGEAMEGGADAGELEFVFEDFAAGLFEEEVAGFVTAEDFKEERGADPLLAGRGTDAAGAGVALEDEAGDAGDFAEFAAAHFRGVEAGEDVVFEGGGAEEGGECGGEGAG